MVFGHSFTKGSRVHLGLLQLGSSCPWFDLETRVKLVCTSTDWKNRRTESMLGFGHLFSATLFIDCPLHNTFGTKAELCLPGPRQLHVHLEEPRPAATFFLGQEVWV